VAGWASLFHSLFAIAPRYGAESVCQAQTRRKILSQRGGGRDFGAVPLLGGEDAAGHAAENPVLCVTCQAGHPLSRNYQMHHSSLPLT